jgi:hypothetical protein
MADEILVNKRIDQLDPGFPVAGDYFVFRDMTNGGTKKVLAEDVLGALPTQNYEWQDDEEYDIDEVVTYGGEWYQSLQNVNEGVIPGDSAGWEDWWDLISKSRSFDFWAEGTYIDTNTVVYRIIGGYVHMFQLKASEPRPFYSSDFDTEHAAGTWEMLGAIETIEFNVAAAPIVINCLLLPFLTLTPSGSIAINKGLTLSNIAANARHSLNIQTTVAGLTITFTNTVKCSSGEFAADVLTLPFIGHYRLDIYKQNGITFVDVFYYN